METVQEGQLLFVSIVFVSGLLSNFLTSRLSSTRCIRRDVPTKLINFGIFLGLCLLHMIPAGFARLLSSENIWLRNAPGLCVATGVVVGIFIQSLFGTTLTPSSPSNSKETLSTPSAHIPPQEQPFIMPDPRFCYPSPITCSMTMDPTLYYPQNYNWDNMSDVHCNSAFAVTKPAETLSQEYPFTPQKDDIVLQSFPQYSIPNYIQTNPQVTIGYGNHTDQDIEKKKADMDLQRTSVSVLSFIVHGFFLSIVVSTTKTVPMLLLISPSIFVCQLIQYVWFATLLQDNGGLGQNILAVVCVHLSFPVITTVFVILQVEGLCSWELPVEDIIGVCLLLSGGCLLYSCMTFVYTDIPKTRTNLVTVATTLFFMFLLSICTNLH